MTLSDNDLHELWSRCLMASQRGYTIAHAEEYAAALIDEADLDSPSEGEISATHLLALATAAKANRLKPKSKKAKKSAYFDDLLKPIKIEAKAMLHATTAQNVGGSLTRSEKSPTSVVIEVAAPADAVSEVSTPTVEVEAPKSETPKSN